MKTWQFGLVKRRNLRDLLNQKGLGLTFVEKSTENTPLVEDPTLLKVLTLNVERLVLLVKCRILKKDLRVNKKEPLKRKIHKEVKAKNL
jgi:hypothetical protein